MKLIDFIKQGYRKEGIRFFSHFVLLWLGKKQLKQYEKYFYGTLVDLGCGDASIKDYFIKFVDQYIGVDLKINSYHIVKPDIVSDLNKEIQIEDNSVDTLIAISVIEHLKEPKRFLEESYRIAKKNSFFILHVPFQWWIHEQPNDYYRFTKYGLEYLFNSVGFKVYEIKPVNGFFFILALKINYFTIRIFNLPKIVWLIWLYLLSPIWIINQLFALILDKLFDKNYDLETSGYWILARKE